MKTKTFNSSSMLMFTSEDHIRYAHGIVSDYLASELSEELRTSMG